CAGYRIQCRYDRPAFPRRPHGQKTERAAIPWYGGKVKRIGHRATRNVARGGGQHWKIALLVAVQVRSTKHTVPGAGVRHTARRQRKERIRRSIGCGGKVAVDIQNKI